MVASQPGEHQFGHRQVDERLAAGMCAFKIAGEAAVVRDPGIGALDHPSSGKDMKAFGNDRVPVHFRSYRSIRALDASPRVSDDLHADPIEVFFDPLLKGSLIRAIGPHKLETRELSDQSREQDLAPFPIGDVGGKHFDCDQQTERVHQQVPFPALNFFSPRRTHAHHHGRNWF